MINTIQIIDIIGFFFICACLFLGADKNNTDFFASASAFAILIARLVYGLLIK